MSEKDYQSKVSFQVQPELLKQGQVATAAVYRQELRARAEGNLTRPDSPWVRCGDPVTVTPGTTHQTVCDVSAGNYAAVVVILQPVDTSTGAADAASHAATFNGQAGTPEGTQQLQHKFVEGLALKQTPDEYTAMLAIARKLHQMRSSPAETRAVDKFLSSYTMAFLHGFTPEAGYRFNGGALGVGEITQATDPFEVRIPLTYQPSPGKFWVPVELDAFCITPTTGKIKVEMDAASYMRNAGTLRLPRELMLSEGISDGWLSCTIETESVMTPTGTPWKHRNHLWLDLKNQFPTPQISSVDFNFDDTAVVGAKLTVADMAGSWPRNEANGFAGGATGTVTATCAPEMGGSVPGGNPYLSGTAPLTDVLNGARINLKPVGSAQEMGPGSYWCLTTIAMSGKLLVSPGKPFDAPPPPPDSAAPVDGDDASGAAAALATAIVGIIGIVAVAVGVAVTKLVDWLGVPGAPQSPQLHQTGNGLEVTFKQPEPQNWVQSAVRDAANTFGLRSAWDEGHTYGVECRIAGSNDPVYRNELSAKALTHNALTYRIPLANTSKHGTYTCDLWTAVLRKSGTASVSVEHETVPTEPMKAKAIPQPGGQSMRLTWDAPTDPGSSRPTYVVTVQADTPSMTYSTDDTNLVDQTRRVVETRDMATVVAGLEGDVTYNVTIAAKTSAGTGAPVTFKSRTLPSVPNKPTAISLTQEPGTTNIVATFKYGYLGGGDLANALIECLGPDRNWTAQTWAAPDRSNPSLTFFGAQEGATYTCGVRSATQYGNSEMSALETINVNELPSTPSLLALKTEQTCVDLWVLGRWCSPKRQVLEFTLAKSSGITHRKPWIISTVTLRYSTDAGATWLTAQGFPLPASVDGKRWKVYLDGQPLGANVPAGARLAIAAGSKELLTGLPVALGGFSKPVQLLP